MSTLARRPQEQATSTAPTALGGLYSGRPRLHEHLFVAGTRVGLVAQPQIHFAVAVYSNRLHPRTPWLARCRSVSPAFAAQRR